MFTPQGMESMGINLKDMMGGLMGRKSRKRMTIADARRILLSEEEEKLIDRSQVETEAITRVEETGIVFLDEIDKICSREDAEMRVGEVRMCLAKACSATFCRSLREPTSTPDMA